ncbi:hypothetical protein G9A89_005462 [Geosiphon pyriformis]|nr:hypothetical protein G9A89_005462 [Geosiphon pyriformis]
MEKKIDNITTNTDESSFTFVWKIPHFKYVIDNNLISSTIYSEYFVSPASKSTSTSTSSMSSMSSNKNWKTAEAKVKKNSTTTNSHFVWRLGCTINSPSKNTYVPSKTLGAYLWAFQSEEEKLEKVDKRSIRYQIKLFHVIRDELNFPEKYTKLATTEISQGKFDFAMQKTGFGFHNICPIDEIFDENHPREGDIDLIIQVSIWNQLSSDQIVETNLLISEKIQDTSFFETLFDNTRLSDLVFTFSCGSRLNAHRVVLAARSTYFDKMYDGDWIETKNKEVLVTGVTYETFRALVYYLYTNRIPVEFPTEKLPELYSDACMRVLKDLAKTVVDMMLAELRHDNWDELFLLGWKHEDTNLKIGAMKYAIQNWEKSVVDEQIIRIAKVAGVKGIELLMGAKFFGV